MPYIALSPSTAAAAPVLTVGAPEVSRGETLSSFESELMLQLGGRDDIPSSRLRRWINWGYIDLATSIQIDELQLSYSFSTVNAQPLYLVPNQLFSSTGLAVVDSNHIDGGWPLEKLDRDVYRGMENQSGDVDGYFRHNKLFVLYPTPDAAKTVVVDGWLRPDFMTADNHSPVLQLEWHEAILLAAKEKAYDGLMETELAQITRNQWINMVRRRRDRTAEEDTGRYAGMVPATRASQLRRNRNSRQTRDD